MHPTSNDIHRPVLAFNNLVGTTVIVNTRDDRRYLGVVIHVENDAFSPSITLNDFTDLSSPFFPLKKLTIPASEIVSHSKAFLPNPDEEQKKTLASYLLQPYMMEFLPNFLQGAYAQIVVDVLSDILSQCNTLRPGEKKRVLHLLCEITKSTQVFPKALELTGVDCNLSQPINEGSFGIIYKGKFKEETVCIKAVRMYQIGAKKEALRAHAGELVLGAYALHPNVLPFYGAFISNEPTPRICIISPWMEGGNLVDYLHQHPDIPRVSLVSDMLRGLLHLHQMGIVHADLKGSNVLVSQARAILADFGVSRIALTGTNTVAESEGTPNWMAPELVNYCSEEPPPATRESDMWGFGCVCYEVLAGKIPFREYKPIQLIRAFMSGNTTLSRPDSSHNIPYADDIWSLAEKCLRYDPSERPTADVALEIVLDLEAIDERPPMTADPRMSVKRPQSANEVDYAALISIIQQYAVMFDPGRQSREALDEPLLSLGVPPRMMNEQRGVDLTSASPGIDGPTQHLLSGASQIPESVGGQFARGSNEALDLILSDVQKEKTYFACGLADIYRGQWTRKCGEISLVVAIKLVRGCAWNGVLTPDRARERFLQEAHLWTQLRHPNIVTFHGLIFEGNFPALVMPYYENGDLLEFLKKHPTANKSDMIRQVAAGLEYLHTLKPNPVIHGNIKASSIMVTDGYQACLTDPGFAKVLSVSGFTTSSLRGTSIRWISPELLEDRTPSPTLQSDIWAFAMTILQIITGKVPFEHLQNVASVILSLMRGELPQQPAEINDALWTLLKLSWNTEPMRRPTASSLFTVLSIMASRDLSSNDVKVLVDHLEETRHNSKDNTPNQHKSKTSTLSSHPRSILLDTGLMRNVDMAFRRSLPLHTRL